MYFQSGLPPNAFALGSAPQYVAVNAFPNSFPCSVPQPFAQAFVPSGLPLPQYSAPPVSEVQSRSTSSMPNFPLGLVEHKASFGGSAATSPEAATIASSASAGWGLSLTSSPASSLTSQPYYFMIQSQMPYGQMAPVGCPPGMLLQPAGPSAVVASHAPRHPTQDNGSKYVLNEWYEGVVKRYNPMRGFGFLTATQHFRQQTQGDAQGTNENPATATATATNTEPTATASTGNEAGEGLKGSFVREPIAVGDIFVHQSYIQMHGFRALTVGERVFFRVGVLHGKRAHQAIDVQRVEDVMGTAAATDGESHSQSLHANASANAPADDRAEAQGPTIDELLQIIGRGAGHGVDADCTTDFALPSPFFARDGGMGFARTPNDEAEHTMPPHVGVDDGSSSEEGVEHNYIGIFEDK